MQGGPLTQLIQLGARWQRAQQQQMLLLRPQQPSPSHSSPRLRLQQSSQLLQPASRAGSHTASLLGAGAGQNPLPGPGTDLALGLGNSRRGPGPGSGKHRVESAASSVTGATAAAVAGRAASASASPGVGAPYSDLDALRWCLDVALALQYLHAHNPPVVHRDVKTDNVLLTALPPRARAQQQLVGVRARGGPGGLGVPAADGLGPGRLSALVSIVQRDAGGRVDRCQPHGSP